MSGIAGLMSLSWPRVESGWAEKMAELMVHRGPAREGRHSDPAGRCAVALRQHRATPGQGANLPIFNEHRDIWAVLDGQIYNARALRHSLELEGHLFRDGGEAEVVVHAYEQYGLNFLEHLQGMFGLALWDERSGRLILARDRMGKKPLYYTQVDGYLAFASESKALLGALPIRRCIDRQALAQYLSFGYVMPPLTLYDGIFKLAAGEALICERKGGMRRTTWWKPLRDHRRTQAVQRLDEEVHVANIRTLLESAVADRLYAEPPAGAFLSGGLDSACVAALMQRLLGRQIDTLTIAHPQAPEADEAAYGRLVAKTLGTRHHELAVQEAHGIASLTDYVYHMDEPLADPCAINSWWASKHFRDIGLTVALSGDGADEVLLGDPSYLRYGKHARAWRLHSRLPRTFWGLLPRLFSMMGRGLPEDLLSRARRGDVMYLGSELPFGEDEHRLSILGPQLREDYARFSASDVTRQVQQSLPEWLDDDALALISCTETRMRLAEKVLMRLDKMSMAHGVEARTPFADHALADYCLAIPGNLRAGEKETKRLLRRAVAELVPDAILARPRRASSAAPVARWLKGDLGRVLEEKMQLSGLFRHGILDAQYCRKLLGLHHAEKGRHHQKLWAVLLLAEWYDQSGMDGMAVDANPANDLIPLSQAVQAAE
ncbi:asparagine synthase (glutamine-hydrolyzing) [Telmatospirillum sp. J64-1]|uniref:asparagine synthase (glutamine-hydrolyzing) n=1 Tax=Telmatospirillum sp. J64-1 TaxID=2502183 RepID=UPI00115DE3E0|nr:asparagine synthase (glutamine-hydrolyzing) [Telmatospirillum sp. J64-1]